jgi:beta-glucosidase
MLDYDIRHGHTYLYARESPQYHFGYGLSYTSFELGALETSADSLTLGGQLDVSVDLRNSGARAGDEVVQLYVRHVAPRGGGQPGVDRPARALKGFRRVHLAAGETARVSIPLRGRDLAYWNVARHGWDLENGRIEILVGTSSRESDLRARKLIDVSRGR